MAKKHQKQPPRSGWPRGEKRPSGQAKFAAVQSLADRFARGALPDAEHNRYTLRLSAMLREWPDFSHVRFDTMELQSALRSLPDGELTALLNPDSSPRRAEKARAELIQMLFEPDLVNQASAALGNAIGRAGSQDDSGALALALFSMRTLADRSLPVGANPLLNLMLNASLADLHVLGNAMREIDQAAAPKEGETPPDEETLRTRRREAMEKHPAFQRDAAHRAFTTGHRLLSYLDTNIIRASLPPEALAPLFAEAIKQPAVTPAGTEAQPQGEAAGGQADSETGLGTRVRAFAADPANEPLFRKFADDLAAEARAAMENAHPLAARIAALADFVSRRGGVDSAAWFIVAQGCLARLFRQLALAQADAAPSPSASGSRAGPTV